MTTIDPSALTTSAAYRLMTGVVVPRPIAWVTTLSEERAVNLAPFSCYTIVSNRPVLVGISISQRPDGRKDTAANIVRDREFVLNVANESDSDSVHRSSEHLPAEVSEAELLGLTTQPSTVVQPPRLSLAPVALECTLDQVLAFGDGGSEFFVGRVELIHVRDGLYRDGKIDTSELRPLSRIAGPNYSKVETVLRYTTQYQIL
jgi:flavin reductase (DIM6/NTAB) family NADH-FMN oxidoreductase RutF